MVSQRHTFATNSALAFLAGIAIYQVVLVISGLLAGMAIPRGYFDWFGRSRLELAWALVDTVTFSIPIMALTTCLTLLTHRLLKAPSVRVFMLAIVLGALATCAYWAAWHVLVPPAPPTVVAVHPASVRLTQLLMPPWSSLPNVIAPWLGFAIAGLLMTWRIRRRA